MSYFLCPNCKHESHIFGTDGAIKEAERQNLKLLGSIPLNKDICLKSDNGQPIVAFDSEDNIAAKPYFDIASQVLKYEGHFHLT